MENKRLREQCLNFWGGGGGCKGAAAMPASMAAPTGPSAAAAASSGACSSNSMARWLEAQDQKADNGLVAAMAASAADPEAMRACAQAFAPGVYWDPSLGVMAQQVPMPGTQPSGLLAMGP